jgi:hypothetical protein
MKDGGLGKFLQKLQAGQDSSNNSNNSEDDSEQEFHSPIKEPRIAPALLATTTDIATTHTPAAAMIVAARPETQNAATSSARGCSCYNNREPNSCYSSTSFYRRGDTRIHRFIYDTTKGLTEMLCSAIFKEQAKEKVKERCTVQKRCRRKGDPQHTLPCSPR